MSRRPPAVALAFLVGACGNLTSFGKGEPEEPEVLLHELLVTAVELDQLKPMLVALQGKSFQPARVDDVLLHIGVAAGRLQAGVDDPYAAGVAVNLAGLAYDILRLDAEASARGFGGAVHATTSLAARAFWEGMAAYELDPEWAFEHRAEAVALIARVIRLRDNGMAAAPWANVMSSGVTAASMTSAAVGLIRLTEQGMALARLVAFMRGARASTGVLAVEGAGASVGLRLVVAGGGALALTEAEVAGLVQAGILSAVSLNLMMSVAGKGKAFDPKAFAEWEKRLPRKPAPNSKPAEKFQVKWCGPEEIQVFKDGQAEGWTDGVQAGDGHLLEAKHVGDPRRSPFIEGSELPDGVRSAVRERLIKQFRKYGTVVLDPAKPPVGLEIITNDSRAVPYFEKLLHELGIPGRVTVRSP